MFARLRALLDIYPLEPITVKEIDPLFRCQASSDINADLAAIPSFRIHRYSEWAHQWPYAGRPAEAASFLRDSMELAMYLTGTTDWPRSTWRAFAIGLSGLDHPDQLSPSHVESVQQHASPARQIPAFVKTPQTGIMSCLSVPTPDSLLVGRDELQRLLLGMFGGASGVRPNFDGRISSLDMIANVEHLVKALADPSYVDSDIEIFMHYCDKAGISRLAQMLGARICGAGGRNAVSRRYLVAPPSAYVCRYQPNGKRYFECTYKPACWKQSKTPIARGCHCVRCVDLRTYRCDRAGCTRNFNVPHGLEDHQSFNHDGELLSCGFCIERFSSGSSLTRHRQTAHAAAWAEHKAAQKDYWELASGNKGKKKPADV